MKKSFAFLLLACLLFQCSNKSALNDFPNTFVMTAEKAKALGLERVRFHLSYPNNLEVILPQEGQVNENYLELIQKQNGKLSTSLSLGYGTNFGLAHETANPILGEFAKTFLPNLLEQMKVSLQKQYPQAESITIVEGIWFGQKQPHLRAKTHITDPAKNLDHDILLTIIPIIPPKDQKNGLLLIAQTVLGNSNVATFDDLPTKGMIAEVWKTFAFDSQ